MQGKHLHCVWRGSKLHIDDKIALTGRAKRPPEIEVEVMPRAIRLLIPRVKGAARKSVHAAGSKAPSAPRRRGRRVHRIKHAG
jgi:hypothetical protein